jgi:hypothetical protein
MPSKRSQSRISPWRIAVPAIFSLRLPVFLRAFVPFVIVLALLGCRSPGRTTVLTHDDLDVATREMAASLAASSFLADRAPDSPPIVVTINKVENLTSDIIPPAEQWMTMARLQGSLPIRQLSRDRNIRFQIPPERRRLVEGAGGRVPPEQQQQYVPTHVMTALFRSSTRTGRDGKGHVDVRQDYYLLQYQITELQSRQIVWEDAFEFKREASGLLID